MSEFWKYFRDTLAWPLIHAPGPLQAVTQGVALALDNVRDDVVFLRRQWFPALCEPELVADHGVSRGLVRHTKETPEQYRARVVNAYRWHMLGGKTEGLPEILKFYGFDALTVDNLRRYQPSRWAEFQVGLKTPATQAEQAALVADLATLVWLINEYKAARSVLARLYTDTYNRLPTAWSEGPNWSDGFWSHFSGVSVPELGPDGDGLIVSFGMVYRARTETDGQSVAGLGTQSLTGALVPYIDRPVWSRSAWSEQFPRNHGFTVGEVVSLQNCEQTTTSHAWKGPWDKRHWRELSVWDRVLPKWCFRWRSWSKAQAVYGWTEPDKAGTYSDVNACYSLPQAVVIDAPPKWGDVWGHDPRRRVLTIRERYRHTGGMTTEPVRPADPDTGGHGLLPAGTALRDSRWRGRWDSRRWHDYACGVAVLHVVGMTPDAVDPAPPQTGGHDILDAAFAPPDSPPPQTGAEEHGTTQAGPLHNQAWTGSWDKRRWWNYVGQTTTRSETA